MAVPAAAQLRLVEASVCYALVFSLLTRSLAPIQAQWLVTDTKAFHLSCCRSSAHTYQMRVTLLCTGLECLLLKDIVGVAVLGFIRKLLSKFGLGIRTGILVSEMPVNTPAVCSIYLSV